MDARNLITKVRWIFLCSHSNEDNSPLSIRKRSNILSKLLSLVVAPYLLGFFLAFELMILNNANAFIKATAFQTILHLLRIQALRHTLRTFCCLRYAP